MPYSREIVKTSPGIILKIYRLPIVLNPTDMKNCPKCNAEVEDAFEICWNCNYSFTEQQVVTFKDDLPEAKDLDCLRCHIAMIYSGRYRFHEGAKAGALGNLFELFVNRESFDLYLCPKCGKVEFFSPLTKA